jgi:hypothetical protein
MDKPKSANHRPLYAKALDSWEFQDLDEKRVLRE